MLYSMVGIPLTLLTVSNLGTLMAAAFKTVYGGWWSVVVYKKFMV